MAQKLVIGFSRPKKWKVFAELIMWWDRVRYKSEVGISHGFFKFGSGSWNREFIYQAAKAATHFMGGKHFDSINETVEEYELDIDESVVIEIGRECVDREGKPYAVKQVLGQALVRLVWLGSFGWVEMKNPWTDGDKSVNCIEEIGRQLALKLGIESPMNLDDVSVKPFRDWIASLPMARRIK